MQVVNINAVLWKICDLGDKPFFLVNDRVILVLKTTWPQRFVKLGILFLDLRFKFHKLISGNCVTSTFALGNLEMLNWGFV